MIDFDDIQLVDVEMAGFCNLKCPLCILQRCPDEVKPKLIDIEKLKSILSQFHHLNTLSIGGVASEPTLHPQMIDFMTWSCRQFKRVELYTNASAHDEKWHASFGEKLGENALVVFTICGSTEELHSRYRVGSSLCKTIANAKSFASTSNADYIVQYIRFEYNKDDDTSKLQQMFGSHFKTIDTDTMFEAGNSQSLSFNDGICMQAMKSFIYRQKLKERKADPCIQCYSKLNKSVYIDNFCNVLPCARMYGQKMDIDYQQIESNADLRCIECDKELQELQSRNGSDAYYMC